MMSSDNQIKVEIILADILKQIDESHIYKKINQPIEKAAQSYTFIHPEDVTHQIFNDIIQDFVTHLFNKGSAMGIKSKKMAIAEAVAIVEMGYQGSSNGYYAAFLDATNTEINGLKNILQQIKEIFISILRAKYIQWVYDSSITPLGWPTRKNIAEILLKRWETYLPVNMKNIPPAQLADHIPLLINTIQISEEKVGRLTGEVL